MHHFMNSENNINEDLVRAFNATLNNISVVVSLNGGVNRSTQRLSEKATDLPLIYFIGGGNQSTRGKPSTYRKSLTNFIT